MVVDGRYATQLLARHWWETVFFNYRDSGFVQRYGFDPLSGADHAGAEMKCTRRRVDKPGWAKPRWHARYMYGDSIPGCAPKPTPYEVRRAWVRGERLGGAWVLTGGGSFARRAGVIWVRSRGPWGSDRAIVGAPLRCRS